MFIWVQGGGESALGVYSTPHWETLGGSDYTPTLPPPAQREGGEFIFQIFEKILGISLSPSIFKGV